MYEYLDGIGSLGRHILSTNREIEQTMSSGSYLQKPVLRILVVMSRTSAKEYRVRASNALKALRHVNKSVWVSGY